GSVGGSITSSEVAHVLVADAAALGLAEPTRTRQLFLVPRKRRGHLGARQRPAVEVPTGGHPPRRGASPCVKDGAHDATSAATAYPSFSASSLAAAEAGSVKPSGNTRSTKATTRPLRPRESTARSR